MLIPTPEIDEEQERREAEEHKRKAEDILDNPPSDLPPPSEPAPSANVSLTQFDKAVAMLAQVHTKPLASFVGTTARRIRSGRLVAFLRQSPTRSPSGERHEPERDDDPFARGRSPDGSE